MIYVVEMDFRNAEREHDWHSLARDALDRTET